MKKTWFFLFFMAMGLLFFTSCGGEDSDKKEAETKDMVEEDSAEDVELIQEMMLDSANSDMMFYGDVSLTVKGNMNVLMQGTEVIMVDLDTLNAHEVEISDDELKAKTVWQGTGSISFRIWLEAQGKSYEADFYLNKKKLNKKSISSKVDQFGSSYIEYTYPYDND